MGQLLKPVIFKSYILGIFTHACSLPCLTAIPEPSPHCPKSIYPLISSLDNKQSILRVVHTWAWAINSQPLPPSS